MSRGMLCAEPPSAARIGIDFTSISASRPSSQRTAPSAHFTLLFEPLAGMPVMYGDLRARGPARLQTDARCGDMDPVLEGAAPPEEEVVEVWLRRAASHDLLDETTEALSIEGYWLS